DEFHFPGHWCRVVDLHQEAVSATRLVSVEWDALPIREVEVDLAIAWIIPADLIERETIGFAWLQIGQREDGVQIGGRSVVEVNAESASLAFDSGFSAGKDIGSGSREGPVIAHPIGITFEGDSEDGSIGSVAISKGNGMGVCFV